MDRNLCLTETGILRARIVVFRKMLIPFLIFQAIVLACLFFFVHMTTFQIATVLALAFLMLLIFVIRTWNNPGISFRDWGLHLGDASIYLTTDPQRTEIKRGEMVSLVENSKGLYIRGKELEQRIWVPAGVEDYSVVKRTLQSWLRQRQ
jgi:hypothetical protein